MKLLPDFLVIRYCDSMPYVCIFHFLNAFLCVCVFPLIDESQKLFVPPPSSKLNLVGKIEASASEISFRFDEDLMFRIPFRPVVHLTGKVVLKREADTGLISSYQEIWDQDVKTVLKSAKFSGLS